jgi:predicted DCC family thiol-disulfide oxidoreductase YuxK
MASGGLPPQAFPDVMAAAPDESIAGPVLLYDGTCGFCAESVQFVLRHDRRGLLRFAALDSAYGRGVLGRHPELRGFDSVLFVEPALNGAPEKVAAHSSAALRVAEYLGGRWGLLRVARVVPSPIRDAAYRLVARHRHRLSAHGPQCLVPSAQDRARFLP